MTFVYYKAQNNVYSYLAMAISSDTTTLQVNDGDIFPSEYPYILTIEHYDNLGNCVKREIVKCTARNGNALTVERAFEYSVSNDTSNPKQLQKIPFNFVAGDSVSLTLTAEFVTDIQDEISRQLDQLNTAQSCLNAENCRLADIESFINNIS